MCLASSFWVCRAGPGESRTPCRHLCGESPRSRWLRRGDLSRRPIVIALPSPYASRPSGLSIRTPNLRRRSLGNQRGRSSARLRPPLADLRHVRSFMCDQRRNHYDRRGPWPRRHATALPPAPGEDLAGIKRTLILPQQQLLGICFGYGNQCVVSGQHWRWLLRSTRPQLG